MQEEPCQASSPTSSPFNTSPLSLSLFSPPSHFHSEYGADTCEVCVGLDKVWCYQDDVCYDHGDAVDTMPFSCKGSARCTTPLPSSLLIHFCFCLFVFFKKKFSRVRRAMILRTLDEGARHPPRHIPSPATPTQYGRDGAPPQCPLFKSVASYPCHSVYVDSPPFYIDHRIPQGTARCAASDCDCKTCGEAKCKQQVPNVDNCNGMTCGTTTTTPPPFYNPSHPLPFSLGGPWRCARPSPRRNGRTTVPPSAEPTLWGRPSVTKGASFMADNCAVALPMR